MRRKQWQWAYIVGDILLAVVAMFMAMFLRLEGQVSIMATMDMAFYLIGAPVTLVAASCALGAYNGIWAYMGFSDVFRQLFSAAISGIIFLVVRFTGLHEIWISIVAIYAILVFCATVGIRIIPRLRHWFSASRHSRDGINKRAVVVGAGDTGAMLIKRLLESHDDSIYPVAAIDADETKHGMRIAGIPVVGGDEKLADTIRKFSAAQVVIAIPSVNSDRVSDVYNICKTLGVRLRIFKNAVDFQGFMSGDKHALRDVSIEDLLFRQSVKTDMEPVVNYLRGKTIMVTGGAGSIGSELCRQALTHGCKKLIIFDIHENGLFELNEEFKLRFDQNRYVLALGSVRDKRRVEQVIKMYKPDLVFHAAAHKHVPMMEINPMEAVKNNVFGTKNMLECCAVGGVKRFILISTDKAVNPTNIMGATKRMCELLVKSYNGCGIDCVAVRFGNVLGSNGSVIPTFKRQIEAGGPVTVTHKDMTRYFMTIPEAVSLVMTAGTLAKGGEIFVLDMGQPVKIYDLASDLIRLSGLIPEEDIKIVITGLRPGEKLYEELVQTTETVDATSHEKIFVMSGTTVDVENFHDRLDDLQKMLRYTSNNGEKIRAEVFDIISRYGFAKDEEANS